MKPMLALIAVAGLFLAGTAIGALGMYVHHGYVG